MEHAWLSPPWEKLQSALAISHRMQVCRVFLSLWCGGCGGVVYKITKSQELHLMDLATPRMAIRELEARWDWHGIACYA